MSCLLGVNAGPFRSSVRAAAQQLSSPLPSRFLVAAFPPSRCFSSWQSSTAHRQHPDRLWRQSGSADCADFRALLRRARLARLSQPPGVRALGLFGDAVITHYVDLPPNYNDEEGLPFRKKDLEAHEVVDLFGPSMSTPAANRLLRILHGRRVAGTLDDPELRVHTRQFNKDQQRTALKFLRKQVPVDEVTNAGLRAEDELALLENPDANEGAAEKGKDISQELGYKTRLKLYKDDAGSGAKPKDVYGTGAFDVIRAKNKAKWEAELKRREEEKRKQAEEAARAAPGTLQTLGQNQPRAVSPWIEKLKAEATSDLKEPPKMKMWERLLPSALFAGLVMLGLEAYAYFYQPPSHENRLLPDVSPATATVGMLMLANLIVFGMWRVPFAWKLMNRYFLVVAATPRAPSIFGALFSHQLFGHLASNMLFLGFIGVQFHEEVGRGGFLATYLGTGVLSFLGSLTSMVVRNRVDLTTLGASGAIYGIAGAYFWMHRFDGFKVLGLPPDPMNGIQGLNFIGLIVALNVAAMFSKRHMLDIASHFVGLAVGMAAGHFLEKRKEEQASGPVQADKATQLVGRVVSHDDKTNKA
ncbi:hypothetical protein B0T24DRAFT_641254 [Lasiosphaeria ovina]|uniref:Peptidase S54 rhomboid domain-containing protein n=1 Tax=Lasiosphaeria ovina TaxID=92902 RepID=A0AAE0MYZ7_9PEZI|nr:hypothetical protein B0T24DRAFT_641254 [Lasiosphaeria ovina]